MFENDLEESEIDSFNKGAISFKAWPLLCIPEDEDEVEMWVILVEANSIIESRLPNVGGRCQIRLVDPNTTEGISAWWTAQRTHNNFAAAGKAKEGWAKLIAFQVTLVKSQDDSDSALQAIIPNDEFLHQSLDSIVLGPHNAIDVGLFFTKSEATFDAEMNALSRLVRACNIPRSYPGQARLGSTDPACEKTELVEKWLEVSVQESSGLAIPPHQISEPAPPINSATTTANSRAVQPKQVAAFKYLLNFRDPEFTVNMFRLYPHMRDPNKPGSGIPSAITRKYARMNEHQRSAYEGLLSNMPCGLAILPGGPGGGKTDWAMTVISVMQSKSRGRVLYLLDINDPLDDATAKYMRLMDSAGLPKLTIRMKNFGTELKRSVRIGATQEKTKNGGTKKKIFVTNSEEPEVDFSKNFLALYTQYAAGAPPERKRTRHQDILLTLDEAAWDHYEKNKSSFSDLTEVLETCNGSALENRSLRCEIYKLYTAVLHCADFIATTPCVAAAAFSRMFTPDLIVFDEAAHARELSTLISIANFCPRAGWIFIGDHRQTQPTVKSNNANPNGKQLATSAMERAHLAGAVSHQLLINHRAFGRLERLPSKLIYEGKMVSGIPFKERFPRWASFVRQYLESLSGQACHVPRLIVHLQGVGRASQVGTSWYHPQHMAWTMKKVLELVSNQRFRSAENEANQGTILLLAPYKAAVTKYQEAIEDLAREHPNLRIPQRVEARTWDSSQGHEADIVAIDYVREHPTSFMDGMYRFNVGLTRARQGEWHLMHPNMPNAASFKTTQYLRKLYDACASGLDGLSEGRVATLSWEVESLIAGIRLNSTQVQVKAALGTNSTDPANGDTLAVPEAMPTPSTLYSCYSSAASAASLADKREVQGVVSPDTRSSLCDSIEAEACEDSGDLSSPI